MGNQLARMRPKKKHNDKKKPQPPQNPNCAPKKGMGSRDEELIMQQTMAMAKHELYIARLRSESRLLQESAIEPPRHSYSGKASTGKIEFTRSYSTRARSAVDALLDPAPSWYLTKEGVVDVHLETRHFVLVHGGGLGAWCWYKSIALLEDSGFKATAVDLTGSGIEPTDPNRITSLVQYVKPLLELLKRIEATPGHEKVILVGHSIGGACISYAMECFPKLIAKAIFIAATMVGNKQSAFDIFAKQVQSPEALMPKAQIFMYGKGNAKPPTALTFDKSLLGDLFFNVSPAKDVALATLSMRPTPFAPAMEKLTLTSRNYGAVRRFFIGTSEDRALPFAAQQQVLEHNLPERVFTLRGSDHCPFFSKPQSLHRILLEIAHLSGR